LLGNYDMSVREEWLRDRIAVVSGGASGLGAATTMALHAAGARVVVLDSDVQAIASISEKLSAVFEYTVNVADDDAMEAIFAQIEREVGPVSILICCAGIANPGSVVRSGSPMPLEEFIQVVNVNMFGTLNCIRCAVPQMINNRKSESVEAGVIVLTSSIAAFDGQIGQAAYSASKGAVAGMVLPLARELGDLGVRVMGIAPGVFLTPMTESLPQKSREIVFSAVPPFPKRPGKAEEFAELALSIIRNPMLNGDTIRLDGGLRMPSKL
jgi:NAD(P)-dependent dehydrogenase (short-subunit alcohol dehydrogenase family)